MEISLFIIGTFISIIVIMVIGVSINYVAFKSLKEEVDKLNIASDHLKISINNLRILNKNYILELPKQNNQLLDILILGSIN